MYRLLQFIKKYYVLSIFIVLEAVAINYYATSSSYVRAKLTATSNQITGDINSLFHTIEDYFTLRKKNRELLARITELENMIAALPTRATPAEIDPNSIAYYYTSARLVGNSISRQENYFVINKGLRDGIEPNMAILTPDGKVAGYVEYSTDKFSSCMSVLNRNFRLGGRIKGKDYFGSVYWNGISPEVVTLSDIPRSATLAKGDTIVSVYSTRFPSDSYIGTIRDFRQSDDGTYYEANVELAAQMGKISDVIVVKYNDADELREMTGMTN